MRKAGSGYLFRKLDIVAVKGRKEPETIYELVGREQDVTEQRRAFVQGYETAFELYLQREFARAKEALESLQGDYHGDLSVARLLQACSHCMETPPGPDWDGVTRYAVKSPRQRSLSRRQEQTCRVCYSCSQKPGLEA